MQKTLFNKVALVSPLSSYPATFPVFLGDLTTLPNELGSSSQMMMNKEMGNEESMGEIKALPSNMIGLKVELAGRLTTQRSVPRKTVSNSQKGSFVCSASLSKSENNSSLDFTQYTSKNKFGAFTIKV